VSSTASPTTSPLGGPVVDLSARRSRPWLPSVDSFGRPAENALYIDLVRTASFSLTRDGEGAPTASVTEGGSLLVFKIPSPGFIAFLDGWRLARHRSLLEDPAVAKFVRLVSARVSSYDFEPDSAIQEPWDESVDEPTLPRVTIDPFEALRGALDRLSSTRVFAFRSAELALALSRTEEEVRIDLVRFDGRLRASGFGVMTVPSSGGPIFLVLRLRGRRLGSSSTRREGGE
jgi:hypothetical protein